MIIRQETEKDFDDIHELVKEAFQTAKVSNGEEQNFVRRLRAGQGYIPDLALVAEEGGKLIGHIMLTHTEIVQKTGVYPLLLLAPLCVSLVHRGKGLGERLIEDACARAAAFGARAVILVGDPAFYGRFGFERAALHGI